MNDTPFAPTVFLLTENFRRAFGSLIDVLNPHTLSACSRPSSNVPCAFLGTQARQISTTILAAEDESLRRDGHMSTDHGSSVDFAGEASEVASHSSGAEHVSPGTTPLSLSERAIKPRRRRFRSGIPTGSLSTSKASRPLILTFDAFGTLFAPKSPIEVQYASVAAAYGLGLNSDTILRSFKNTYKMLSASHPNYGRATNMSPATWWTHIIYNTLRPLLPDHTPIPRDLIYELYNRFATSDGYSLFQDVPPFLQLLGTSWDAADWAPQRTILGVLSNSDPRVRSILHSFNVPIVPSLFPPRYAPHSRRFHANFGPATFGFATLSYECGAEKPDSRIFDSAVRDATSMMQKMAFIARLTRTGMQMLSDDVREEFHFMHVGDDLEKDVLAARSCGWDGILLDRSAEEEVSERQVEVKGEEEPVVICVVNSLMALRHLVTRERLHDGDGKPRQSPVYLDPSVSPPKLQYPGRRRHLGKRYFAGRRNVPHPASTTGNPLVMLE